VHVLMATRACFPLHGLGGLQNYVWNLALHLKKRGNRVSIVAPVGPQSEAGHQTIEDLDFLLVGVNVGNVLDYFRFVWSLSRSVRDMDFDVAHCFGMTGLFLFKWCRKPVVVQAFGAAPCKVKGMKYRLINSPICYALKYSYQRADAIAVQGERERADLELSFKVTRAKAVDLPVGVDIERFRRVRVKREETRRRLGLPASSIVLITVGRLHPAKGIPHLLEALDLLRAEQPEVCLLLIGEGGAEQAIMEIVRTKRLEGRVWHLKGISERELSLCYGCADVCVHPSALEGLPTVILEAMASGLPVVATGGPDVENARVVKDGLNGYLVPPGDPASIAEAVRKITGGGEAEAMGRESLRIVGDYDWSRIAAMAEEHYGKLLGG